MLWTWSSFPPTPIVKSYFLFIHTKSPISERNTSKQPACNCVAEAIRRVTALRKLATQQGGGWKQNSKHVLLTDGEFTVVQNNEIKWAKLFMEFIIGTAYCQSSKCQGMYRTWEATGKIEIIQLTPTTWFGTCIRQNSQTHSTFKG